MDYVVDANVLISMLISGRASYYTLAKSYRLYTPDYALLELETYRSVVLVKSSLQTTEVRSFMRRLFPWLRIIPSLAIDPDNLERAKRLTHRIDPKDEAYVALALQTGATLLSRDKALVNGVRKNGFRQIVMFDHFLREV